MTCAVQGDGVRFCGSSAPRSTTKTFDGDADRRERGLPARARIGPGRPLPADHLVHGYGGSKIGLSDMQHWLDRGYATFSMTDRGFRESCGSRGLARRRRHRLRERLHPPDGQPLRGPRRAVLRRRARRRGPGRPAAGSARSAAPTAAGCRWRSARSRTAKVLPDGSARALDEPGRHADADRGGGAEHPVDRPRLLADAERQHARLRRRRALHGPVGRREAVASSTGSTCSGWRAPASTRPPAPIPTPT